MGLFLPVEGYNFVTNPAKCANAWLPVHCPPPAVCFFAWALPSVPRSLSAFMQPVRRAVIDVGTNSIKLLVADVSGRDVRPVHEESRQTRLGRGFYETHRLQPDTIAHTAEAVWEFANTAREKNSDSIRVIATSAARDAVNPGDLTSAIERVSDLKVEIISGEREAGWVFKGVTTDAALAQAPLLLLDVGGGSTEFILGQGEHKHFARSFPLGTVRLMEKFPHSDPPTRGEFNACRDWLKSFLRTEVRPQIDPALRREARTCSGEIQLVGTGGTTSILARMENQLDRFDRDRIEATRLSFPKIVAHRRRLWRLPLAGRKETPGLPKLRADVILTGVLIYEAVMKEFGFEQLRVSTRGLRFAAVMDGSETV
jgi:exopolyphosphatase / guanosine-5'-triphosphate,3'-diphosphate pyrophosphatase